MEKFRKYLNKSCSRIDDIRQNNDPSIVVAIPAFSESMILKTLSSIYQANIPVNIMVLIIVNYSEKASVNQKKFNLELFKILQQWCADFSSNNLAFNVVLESEMPKKHAGAGLARKTGMDTAIEIFYRNQNHNGVIASLDADCSVASNYFEILNNHFNQLPETNILLLDFQHDTSNVDFPTGQAIVKYELYLNYYVLACRLVGFPYAYHTIGSAFAVKADAYVREGGMNKKQAGEDFYFLQKMFPLEHIHRTYETCVYPSPRVSSRVPFGTGPAMKNILENELELLVYNPAAFFPLQDFFYNLSELYASPGQLSAISDKRLGFYFDMINFEAKVREAKNNSASSIQFSKRLLQHFNAFQLVKYLNFVHEKGFYTKTPVIKAIQQLLFRDQPCKGNIIKLLQEVRYLERTIPLHRLK